MKEIRISRDLIKFIHDEPLMKAEDAVSADAHHKQYQRRSKTGKLEQIKQKGALAMPQPGKLRMPAKPVLKKKPVSKVDAKSGKKPTKKVSADTGKSKPTGDERIDKLQAHYDSLKGVVKPEVLNDIKSVIDQWKGDAAKKIEASKEPEKIKDFAGFSKRMEASLKVIQWKKPVLQEIGSGNLHDQLPHITENAKKTLKSYSGYLAGDSALLANDTLNLAHHIIRSHKDEFLGVDSKALNDMLVDSVKKMVFQEIESNRSQYTDHGIRHISKNIQTQSRLLDTLAEKGENITGRQRLLALFVMVNHDAGYVVNKHGHENESEKLVVEQKAQWDENKIFSGEEYDKATYLVKTHGAAQLVDKGKEFDSLTVATRLADDLSLFQEEKLPSVFQYVRGGKEILVKMGQAAKANDTKAFEELRAQLHESVDKTPSLGRNLRRDLKAATYDITHLTPKFTMGSLAGEVSEIKGGEGSLFSVKIRHNDFDAEMQQMFDMGQAQTKKFLESYGIKDFNQKKYDIGDYKGKPILSLEVD